MAGKMRTEKRRLPTMATATVGKDDQRIRAEMGLSIADGGLPQQRAAWQHCKGILGRRGAIVARILCGSGIPQLTREPAPVSHAVDGVPKPYAYRKRPTCKGIIVHRQVP